MSCQVKTSETNYETEKYQYFSIVLFLLYEYFIVFFFFVMKVTNTHNRSESSTFLHEKS
jgi:hypothetical protein